MKSGICSKCEAKEIHVVSNTAVEVGVNVSWRETAYLNYYICTNCGYTELFVHDMQLLPKIAEKYRKVHTYKNTDL